MANLTPEGLEEFFNFWNKTVVRHETETPQPLDYQELRKRLELPSRLNYPITPESLLEMADIVLELPPETEDLPLIRASSYWLVKQHFPWAVKK